MIEVRHLTKNYGNHPAVSDLSFTIEQGHIYGFLGPNGAGKSTTMNMLTGCLAATSGDISIGGYDIIEQPKLAKKLIGYLPELPPLYQDQTVREYLTFVAAAKGFSRKDIPAEIQRCAEETHIENVIDRLIRHLSKGYRQRVGIAQALIGNPEIIILDEPTVGLDPMQIIEIRDLIRTLGQSHTVILSSHILSEIQAVCDIVLIIHHGRLAAFDTLENLSGGSSIELTTDASPDRMTELLGGIEAVQDIRVTDTLPEGGCSAVLTVDSEEPREICREVFRAFAEADTPILQLNPVRRTLEDIFIQITGEKAVASAADTPTARKEPAEAEASEESEASAEAETPEEDREEAAE